MIGRKFDWDPDKARSNEIKHGISFYTAMSVFRDPRSVEWADEDIDHEDRWKLLGMTVRGILLVIYVERYVYAFEGNATPKVVTRIISARRANKHEQRLYYAPD
jgi:uncharacterized DUF497 family protein